MGYGWYPLLIELAEYLKSLGIKDSEVQIYDIKEKCFKLNIGVIFPMLPDNHIAYEFVNYLEARSPFICERCGEFSGTEKQHVCDPEKTTEEYQKAKLIELLEKSA